MKKFTLLHFGEREHLRALIGCLESPTDEPSENPLPQHHFYQRFHAFQGKVGGKLLKKQCLSEHPNWNTLSLLSKPFGKRLASIIDFLHLPMEGDLRGPCAGLQSGASSCPLLPQRRNLLPKPACWCLKLDALSDYREKPGISV